MLQHLPLIETKGCQCSINELWSDLSVTSREMKWASGKKVGTSESFCIKSFIQFQPSYMTSHPIKTSFFLWVGSILILFVPMQSKLKKKCNIYPSKLKLGGLGFKGTYSNHASMLCMLKLFQRSGSGPSLSSIHTHPYNTSNWSLSQEALLEEEMAPHSSVRAWEIPWTEGPGRLRSIGLQRVGHDLATLTTLHTHTHTPQESYLFQANLTGRKVFEAEDFFPENHYSIYISLLKATISPLKLHHHQN